MPSFATVLSLAALLAPGLASPLSAKKLFARENCPTGDAHYSGTDWCSTNPEDSVIILSSDTKVSFGERNPGDIIQSVRDHCSNGVCETEWSLDTMWVKERDVTTGKLVVIIATQVTDPVHLGPMLNALQYTLDRVLESRDEMWLQPVPCSTSVCPQPTEHNSVQMTGPSGLTMQIREKGNDKPLYERPVVSSITISLKPEQDETFTGGCAALGGVAAAAAGALNPILGVIGTMAQIGCLAAP